MNNLKEIKTTIIGILLLYLSLDYEFDFGFIEEDAPNQLYFVGGLIGGIGLLLAPDDIIGAIRRLVKKQTK